MYFIEKIQRMLPSTFKFATQCPPTCMSLPCFRNCRGWAQNSNVQKALSFLSLLHGGKFAVATLKEAYLGLSGPTILYKLFEQFSVVG